MYKKWGNCNFKDLINLQNKIINIDNKNLCEDIAKELAGRLLSKVIKKTPVGEYKNKNSLQGGTLRKNWAIGENIKIIKNKSNYAIEVVNNTEYASYVEYGHRTRNNTRWVKGRFMMSISENEIKNEAPAIIEDKIKKYLEREFKC